MVQKNTEGEIIGEFSSIKEAEKKTGCNSSKIVLVCQGKRKHTAAGCGGELDLVL
mgnify:CR=1 FL=1